MKLYLLRHGNADWAEWNQPDTDRPLTEKGRKKTRRTAKLLCRMKELPALVLSSPLPRAWQTAEIVAQRLESELRQECELSPGFNAEKLRKILARGAGDDLMIVGHEPDFSAVIRALTGAEVKLAKGAVARIDLVLGETRGRLIWLIPPKAAR
jgi:phosphohistidine phosphatase